MALAVRQLLAGQRRARLMQQGALVVLAGAVNAGKSSLLNALLGRNRALVTDIPGTTRDFLEEACDLDGLPVRLTDTAGLRATDEAGNAVESVEELGVAMSREKLRQADAVVLVLDGERLGQEGANARVCPDPAALEALQLAGEAPVLLVWNKCDLCRPASFSPRWAGDIPCCVVSAGTGENLEALAAALRGLLLAESREKPASGGLAPNARASSGPGAGSGRA